MLLRPMLRLVARGLIARQNDICRAVVETASIRASALSSEQIYGHRSFCRWEGTPCIRCPQDGCPFQLRHLTETSRSAPWTMMESSTRSCSRVASMETNGSMLQMESASTFSRRIGANGMRGIKSSILKRTPWQACDNVLPERSLKKAVAVHQSKER
jgi:hypothetical protein